MAYSQAERIVNQEPIPNFIPGETRPGLQGSNQTQWSFSTCKDPIICSNTPLVYSMSLIPFIQLEQNLNILPDTDLTLDDFDDNHYVWWRNTLSNEETFTFLFYGPLITAISTAILFAICRTYNFSIKIAITVAFLYGFTTMAVSYTHLTLPTILLV